MTRRPSENTIRLQREMVRATIFPLPQGEPFT
jgi:hypothetical protein